MNQRAALLQAVIESPDEEAVRLVFADWAEEHGEEERAEFIRVQCALARLTDAEDERLPELARREKELWQAHGAAWCAELPRWARDKVSFRRGFPAILDCTPTQWIGGHNLIRQAPIQTLAINKPAADKLAAFAATAHLAGVRSLRLAFYSLSQRVAALRAISGSACGPGLRVFDFNRGDCMVGSRAGDGLAEALAAAPFPSLECLRLTMTEVGPAGAAALAASPLLSRMQKLDLADNPIGVEGARALAESPRTANLTALSLADCGVTDRGVEALAGSPHLARLTHLNLRGYGLTTGAALAVAASAYLTRLTALSFHFGTIGTEGARALARSPNCAHLTHLNLFQNRIGDAGLRALVESPHLTRLRTLELGGNGLTAEGLRALAAPGMARLERLGLWGTPGVEDVVRELRASPLPPRLREMAFYPNWLENATKQEIDEHFLPLHGEAVAKRQ
jgi:uncharacterized protein (TIGR02996 family)